MTDTLPTLPPPVPSGFQEEHVPTPDQEKLLQSMLKRFSASDYGLPGVEEGKEALMEEEKFWLVSSFTARERWVMFTRG
jgi:hypothetical protein